MRALFFIFISGIVLSVSAQIPGAGLVGYWPFTGNAGDSSGYGNDGVVNGATLTTDRFGNPNCAYNFNGSSNVALPHDSVFEFGTDSDFSISVWIKPTPVYGTFRFYMAYACPDFGGMGGFQLGIDATTMPLYCEMGTTGPEVFMGGDFSDNQWHHIVLTIDRADDSVRFYHNGYFFGAVCLLDSQNYSPTCNPDILIGGERNSNFSHYFIGDIDDVRIYDRVLNQCDINKLFYEGDTIVETVNFDISLLDTVCVNNPSIDLANYVSPMGGVFSGNGVSGNFFYPDSAMFGANTLAYDYVDSNYCLITIYDDIWIDECLYVNSGYFEDIMVYPNPTSGKVVVELHGNDNFEKLCIYNCKAEKITNLDINKLPIIIFSLEDYPSGIYFIHLSGKQSKVLKLVKE